MHPNSTGTPAPSHAEEDTHEHDEYPLPLGDYKRYGRQMILDGFGLQGAYGEVFQSPIYSHNQ